MGITVLELGCQHHERLLLRYRYNPRLRLPLDTFRVRLANWAELSCLYSIFRLLAAAGYSGADCTMREWTC
eukprot:53076-Eustigmatos_ZCMA.PRE.1